MSSSLWDTALATLKEEEKQGINLQAPDKRTVLEELAAAVKEKKKLCIDGRIKYRKRNGDIIVLHDVFVKIARWLDKFKQIGDISIQYDPAHAALPWAAVRFLIQASINSVQIQEVLVEGLETVCKVIARYAIVEALYLQQPFSVSDLLRETIVATYASILIFLFACQRQYQQGTTRRVIRGVFPYSWVDESVQVIKDNDRKVAELTKLADAERVQWVTREQMAGQNMIESLDTRIQELQIGVTSQVNTLEELIRSFHDPFVRTIEDTATLQQRQIAMTAAANSRAERKEILRWLSTVPYKDHHQMISKNILDGTGSWLLNHPLFRDWMDSSSTSLLWLHGIPGAGKTYLMATVIRHLLEFSNNYQATVPLAYFYCSRHTAEPQRADPTEVVLSLLKQTILSYKDWQENTEIAKYYREIYDKSEEEGTDIPRLNIHEALQFLISESERIPLVLIVDALDECLPNERYKILRAFQKLMQTSNLIVKIMISSREDADIVSSFTRLPNIRIQVSDNTEDIHRYAHAELENAINDRRILNGRVSWQLRDRIIRTLRDKSQGMFLWVYLQISSLCDRRCIKTEQDLDDQLLCLPQSLTAMYASLMEDIQALGENGRSIAIAMFQWLLHSLDSTTGLTLSYCTIAANASHDISMEEVLDICTNLVVHDKITGTFRFAHLSVKEYLQTRDEYSTKYANILILRNLSRAHDLYPRSQFPTGVEIQRYRCYSYFSKNWSHHYAQLSELDRQTIFESHIKQLIFNESSLEAKLTEWKSLIDGSVQAGQLPERYREALKIEGTSITTDFRPWNLPLGLLVPILSEIIWENTDIYHLQIAYAHAWQEIMDYTEAIMSPMLSSIMVAQTLVYGTLVGDRKAFGRWTQNWRFKFNRDWLSVKNRLVSVTQQLLADASTSPSLDMILPFQHLKTACDRARLMPWFLSLYRNNVFLRWPIDEVVRSLSIYTLDMAHLLKLLSQQQVTIDLKLDSGRRTSVLLLAAALEAPMVLIFRMLARSIDLQLDSDTFDDERPFIVSVPLRQILFRELLAWTQSRSDAGLLRGEQLLHAAINNKYYYTACSIILYGTVTVSSAEAIRVEWNYLLNTISIGSRQADTITNPERRASHKGPMIPGFGVVPPSDAISEALLCIAAHVRHHDAVQTLLQMGVNPACPSIPASEYRAQSNSKVQDDASKNQFEDTSKGCRRNELELKQAPLAWAATTGNSSLVRKILDQGVNPNIANTRKQTAMFFAVQREECKDPKTDLETMKLDVVKLLHSQGGDIEWVDAHGKMASWYALQAGYSRIAEWLINSCSIDSKYVLNGSDNRLWNIFEKGESGIAQYFRDKTKTPEHSTDGPAQSTDRSMELVARLIQNGVGRMLAEQIDKNEEQ